MKKSVCLSLVVVLLMLGVTFSASYEKAINVVMLPLTYYVDGVEKAPAEGEEGFVYNGTTYVPLRFISESLGEDIKWDGKNYAVHIGEYSSGSFTYLEELDVLSTDGSGWQYGSVKTNRGVQFIHSLYADGSFIASIDRTYILDGKYKKFSAKIAPLEQWTNSKETDVGEIKFYVDDQLVYSTGVFKSTIMNPLDVDFDVTGALKLRIVVDQISYGSNISKKNLGICDAKLID